MKVHQKCYWVLSLAVLATGCTTTFDGAKVDYKSQGKQTPQLELPPDLTLLSQNQQASVPVGGAANASNYQSNLAQASAAADRATAANAAGDVQVMREGERRWLVSSRPPEQLWEIIKKFWADHGLTIVVDQPQLGIMETDWGENRAKLPQDTVRKYLGGILGGLYSTNERDKYRTRLERTVSGGTEIYITHRGMMQDYTNNDKTSLAWKPRPTDPELEIEFLKRLMVRLGAPQENANAALDVAKATLPSALQTVKAKLEQDAKQSSLVLGDTLEQAWRRVGLSLDRANFTVEDRDRSKGIYFVRYVDPNLEKNQPGFVARLFGAKAKTSLQKYQILLSAESPAAAAAGYPTRLRVADGNGVVLNNAEAKSILKVLLDDLK